MKTRNIKTQVIAISVMILTAALVQACGSGSSSVVPVTNVSSSTCGYNSVGQYTCSGIVGTGNGALYEACEGEGYYAGEESGVNITSANLVNSPDGTQGVCQVVMEAELQPEEYSSRAFLGPNAGSSEGTPTGLSLAPYDSAEIIAEGSYGSGFFSSANDCSGSTIEDDGDVYGAVYGLNPFPLGNNAINVPAYGGGTVYVGLNQTPGAEGCMILQVSAEVERCVDASGNTHPCPSPL